MDFELKKKQFFPVVPELENYLDAFGRTFELPAIYEDLHQFNESFPLFDREGNDTLWKTVHFDPATRKDLNERLTRIYGYLKTGENRPAEHLYMERVDFCDFGNSRPFRVRIVNEFNDNYDHFYVKIADASRVYGLELEHVLSPNRINYLVNDHTLIEEHIAGIPGDIFLQDWLDRPEARRVRVAKEFVKFNERCFIRLLGDMRSYNYVIDITPDFEDVQYRVRTIDFDQQCYEGHKQMYLPQFFPENRPIVDLCTELLNYPTMKQYQNEERNLMARRAKVSARRLEELFRPLCLDRISTPEKIAQLKEELNEYYKADVFSRCETMGEVVKTNVEYALEHSAGR